MASIQGCASVLGPVRSLLLALRHLRLFSDVLARHVATSVYLGRDAEVPLSEALRHQIQQACSKMAQWKGRPFQSQPLPEFQRRLELGVGSVQSGRKGWLRLFYKQRSERTYKSEGVQGGHLRLAQLYDEEHDGSFLDGFNNAMPLFTVVGQSLT